MAIKMNFALKLQWRILSYFNRFIPLEEGEARVVEGNYSGRRPVLAGCRARSREPGPPRSPASCGGCRAVEAGARNQARRRRWSSRQWTTFSGVHIPGNSPRSSIISGCFLYPEIYLAGSNGSCQKPSFPEVPDHLIDLSGGIWHEI